MSASEPVVLQPAKDGVARITIDRREARNALSPEAVGALAGALERFAADPDARVAILTGAGEEAFCVGLEVADTDPGRTGLLGLHERTGAYSDLLRRLARLGKPVVARVKGECLAAGFGLALACDLVVAADDASFATPEVRHGHVPGAVMAALVRSCGSKRALELILTGRRLSGLEAERLGLVNHAVPVEELDARADALAHELAALSPAAVRLARDAFHTMVDLAFEDALVHLQTMGSLGLATEDAREGLAALREERAPVWRGR